MPVPFTALAYQMFSIAQANGLDGYEATGIACNVFDLITGQKKGIYETGDLFPLPAMIVLDAVAAHAEGVRFFAAGVFVFGRECFR